MTELNDYQIKLLFKDFAMTDEQGDRIRERILSKKEKVKVKGFRNGMLKAIVVYAALAAALFCTVVFVLPMLDFSLPFAGSAPKIDPGQDSYVNRLKQYADIADYTVEYGEILNFDVSVKKSQVITTASLSAGGKTIDLSATTNWYALQSEDKLNGTLCANIKSYSGDLVVVGISVGMNIDAVWDEQIPGDAKDTVLKVTVFDPESAAFYHAFTGADAKIMEKAGKYACDLPQTLNSDLYDGLVSAFKWLQTVKRFQFPGTETEITTAYQPKTPSEGFVKALEEEMPGYAVVDPLVENTLGTIWYYGDYHGTEVAFAATQLCVETDMNIGNVTFTYYSSFILYAYHGGELTVLEEAYQNGLVNDSDLEIIVQIHNMASIPPEEELPW